jgi:RimJ/RimL family protein N-acetyltransferase
MRALLADAGRRADMSRRGRQLVDGLGVSRVVACLRAASLRLRPVREEDCRLIWVWSNDPGARAASMSTDEIPWETHQQWFAAHLKSPDCLFYMATDSRGVPIGQVRFDSRGDEAVLSISLAKGMRRRRYGPGMILLASEQCFAETPIKVIHAYCKPENAGALRAFELTRYRDVGLTEERGQPARHFILNRTDSH